MERTPAETWRAAPQARHRFGARSTRGRDTLCRGETEGNAGATPRRARPMEDSNVSGSRRGTGAAALGWSVAVLVGFGVAASESTNDVSILLLGVAKLHGAEFAVSAAQAQQLLPLVQARRDHSWGTTRGASGTAAAVRAILTPEQLTRIRAMHLSLSDAIRWGGGVVDCRMWRPHSWVCPCSDEETPPSPGSAPSGFLGIMPTLGNPYIGFADRVIRVLSGWSTSG